MTYHTAFDISERFPDAVMGAVALLVLMLVVVMSLRANWRAILLRTSWLWLIGAGLLFVVVAVRGFEGAGGAGVAISAGLVTVVLAYLARADAQIPFGGDLRPRARPLAALAARPDAQILFRGNFRPRARPVAAVAAGALLFLAGLAGSSQISSFDLAGRLSSGDVTVVTGVVEDAGGGNWGYECFTVDRHRYCYAESPSTVGFHQTAANGGPIRNGLQVRVSSVGDVIVRLEVADGQ